jgi:tRNA nucleotidyltransferase (CCA-adding enzyme)
MKIITSHLNADFDSLASMVAAQMLYPDAAVVFPGSQERKVRDFIEVFHPVEIRRIRDIDMAGVDTLIIVDTRQADRIGPLSRLLENKNMQIHLYDHHPLKAGDIRGSIEITEDVGATATIFTELLRDRKVSPSSMEATILALGIYEETGCLLFPSTNERDILAVSYLLKRGANLNIVSEYVRHDLGKEELSLLNELITSAKETVIRGIRILLAKASHDSYIGEAALLAHRIMDIEDTDAVILMLNMEGKITVVARSKVPELDVSALLERFGGGGHHAAASATIREDSLETVEDRIAALLAELIKPGKTAADIMTSHVISIPAESSVKEAETAMTKFGVNALPVLRGSEYSGIITRETVEKAIFHGFRKNSVAEFCSTDALTVESDTPLLEIEAAMIEHNQRFMPVLQDRHVRGAITRTDLLRVLYEEFLRKRRIGKEDSGGIHFSSRNLSSALRDRFPANVYETLRLAGSIAEGLGYQAYLVGGSVRDLLLRKNNLDIDLVIEGDGVLFAQAFGEQLHAKVKPHHAFGTAQIIHNDLRIDVATARTEYYESPAALPKVETSSIKKDLYRRDFTINTLAIKLSPPDFGLLFDFFGAQRDLKEKTIRVLHNLSLVEDPTRAFRAIRFSERFGFRLSRHTATLIKSALDMHLFDRLSGPRLYYELLQALLETNPLLTLKKLSDYGLLKVIHRDLTFDKKLESGLSSMSETIAWYNLLYLDEKADQGLLYLMVLFAGLSASGRDEALARLSAPPKTRTLIQQGIPGALEILQSLPSKDTAALYHLLESMELEVILLAMSTARHESRKKDISHFLIELKKVRPLLKGSDLGALGIPQGPVYSEIFRALLDGRLRGSLKTEADEKEFIRTHYLRPCS